MNQIEVLRAIQARIGRPSRVILVVGDELNEAEAVPDGMTILGIIVDNKFLSWYVEDSEWDGQELVDGILDGIARFESGTSEEE